jgi:SAM-dependent methyltransferase
MKLDAIYQNRFDERERKAKDAVWAELCERWFARYVDGAATVLDVGAGLCELINHLHAGRRIAVDANPDLPRFAAAGVETHVARAEEMGFLPTGSVDVAFTSNFLEHLPDKSALTRVVAEVRRVLRPGGRFVVMGPNIRYVAGSYWDYYDHHIPLTEKSVEELLASEGFTVESSLPRFMPYTVKSRLPTARWLVRAYLRAGPLAFRLLGKQFLVVARTAS